MTILPLVAVVLAVLILLLGGLAGWVLRGWSAAYCLECDDELPLFHSWHRTHKGCRQAPPVSSFASTVMAAVADRSAAPVNVEISQ